MMISDRERLVAMFERVNAEANTYENSWVSGALFPLVMTIGDDAVTVYFCFDATGRLLKVEVSS